MWQFQTLNLNLRSYVSESGGTGIAIQMVPVEHAQVDRGVGVLGIVHMLAPVHHQYMHGIKVRATSCPNHATQAMAGLLRPKSQVMTMPFPKSQMALPESRLLPD